VYFKKSDGDYLDIRGTNNFEPLPKDEGYISCWVKIHSKPTAGGYAIAVEWTGSQAEIVMTFLNSTGVAFVAKGGAFNLKEWYHVVGYWQGDFGFPRSRRHGIYINGTLQEEVTTYSGSMNATSVSWTKMGKNQDGNYAFDGAVDHLIVWEMSPSGGEVEYPPTDTEITALANGYSIEYVGLEVGRGTESTSRIAVKSLGFGDASRTSISAIKRFSYGILGKLARTAIMDTGDKQVNTQTAIFRAAYDKQERTSLTTIVWFQAFDKPSNTAVLVAGTELTHISDTHIIHQYDITMSADTRIIVTQSLPSLSSRTIIFKTVELSPPVTSDLRVLKSDTLSFGSFTRIKSGAFIQIWYRSNTTISNRITYDRGSIAAIKRLSYDDKTYTSNVEIVRVTDIVLLSNTAIQHQQETSENSVTTISKVTDLTKLSQTLIMQTNKEILLSGTRILRTFFYDISLRSFTRIERLAIEDIQFGSRSRVVDSFNVTPLTSSVTIKSRGGEFPDP
jgi:hypothetical protein